MKLPVDIIDQLSNEEMMFVSGGENKIDPNNVNGACHGTNNASGTCYLTNNGTGTCHGTNNSSGSCWGVNNGSGVCGIIH